MVIDKTIDSSAMPRAINDAKILLIDLELEDKGTRIDAEIRVNSPEEFQSFSRGISDKLRNKSSKDNQILEQTLLSRVRVLTCMHNIF